MGLLLIGFQPAIAAGNSARLDITGTIPASCAFTTLPTTTQLGTLVSGADVPLGAFGFTCNLATSGSVHVTVQSANGALQRDGGIETVSYQVHWAIQGNASASGNASAWFGAPFDFTLQSGTNGAEQSGAYSVRIVGPTDGLLAGDYKDTLTYTITP